MPVWRYNKYGKWMKLKAAGPMYKEQQKEDFD